MEHIGDFYEFFMPYCLIRQEGGWVVVNRRYKPLGQTCNEWVDYAGHAKSITLRDATLKAIAYGAKGIWRSSDSVAGRNIARVYLYDDATDPSLSKQNMKNYLERLGRLIKLRVRAEVSRV